MSEKIDEKTLKLEMKLKELKDSDIFDALKNVENSPEFKNAMNAVEDYEKLLSKMVNYNNLSEKGYEEYNLNPRTTGNEYIKTFFKDFKDSIGVRYTIVFEFYKGIPEVDGDCILFLCYCQLKLDNLYQNKKMYFDFNVTDIYDKISLESLEGHIYAIWHTLGSQYYENYAETEERKRQIELESKNEKKE